MKTFIYTFTPSSMERGYDYTITVYRIVRNKPVLVGSNDEISAGSWKGKYAVASQIIADKLGHKMSKGHGNVGAGYSLESKNIQLFEV